MFMFLLFPLLLLSVSCGVSKKIYLQTSAELKSQQEKIEKIQQQLQVLQKNWELNFDQQVREVEAANKLITLIQKKNEQYSQMVLNPFIPETVYFCNQKVPLEKFEVRERLQWALMCEMTRWPMALIFLRSGRWFPMIEEKIKQLRLPEDLKYISAVESDLNPQAYSYAGAAGMWQITKITGRNIMGLEINYEIDQRYDPEASTQAALIHLNDLYLEFKEWPSALAGYNMHKDRYQEQLEKKGVTSFYEVTGIPIQTQRYVFRVIAMKLIMENPEQYGFPPLKQIKVVSYPPYDISSKLITIQARKETISSIAQRLDMSYYEFRTFNPHVAPVSRRGSIIRDYLTRGKYKIYIKKES